MSSRSSSRALLVAALALCEAATGMRSLTVRSSAVSASRVRALRMESPLPPPQADSLSLGGSEAAPDPTPTPSSAPPPSASLEDEAFSMFGSEDDELSVVKESLISELGNGINSLPLGASPRNVDRELIAELLLQLEKLNPTEAPATSALLNGKWKFLYSGGQSPGLASLVALLSLASAAPKSPSGAPLIDVGEATVTISRTQPRVEAALRVRVLSLENTLKLFTTLEAKTGSVLVEEYKEIESELFGIKLPLAPPASFSRSLVVSYLDEDLLIVRSLGGAPDVLVRMDKEFSSASASGDGWENAA